jgi:hypothetical protein
MTSKSIQIKHIRSSILPVIVFEAIRRHIQKNIRKKNYYKGKVAPD